MGRGFRPIWSLRPQPYSLRLVAPSLFAYPALRTRCFRGESFHRLFFQRFPIVTESVNLLLAELKTDLGAILPTLYDESRTSFVVQARQADLRVNASVRTYNPDATITVNGQDIGVGKGSFSRDLDPGLSVYNIVVSASGKSRSFELKIVRQHDRPNWEELVKVGPYKIRDSSGQVTHNGKLFILGGYTPELTSDVWSSSDGINWEMIGEIPSKDGINIPLVFSFKGKIWVTDNKGKFFSSPDGKTWDLVSEAIGCGHRYGAGCCVFNDRMWVMGAKGVSNDVWSSSNGIDWRLETEHAPWSPRQVFGNLVVLGDQMIMVGGGIVNYQPFKGYRDVWATKDGKTWSQLTDQAPWAGRIWSEAQVYNNRIWLLGGFRAQPTWQNFNDVWYSADGVNWKLFESADLWSPRHEACTYVHDDALWVVAGNAWPLMNDTWRLKLTGLAFTTQPVIEEYVGCRYDYNAQADFNKSAKPVRFRLIKAPAWLKLDSNTGKLTGIPTEVGFVNVVLEAYDNDGETAQQSFDIRVTSI